MIKRIICYFRGHQPRRNYFKPIRFNAWTLCARCNGVMVRGYYGWIPANDTEERAFRRAFATWTARGDVVIAEPVHAERTEASVADDEPGS